MVAPLVQDQAARVQLPDLTLLIVFVRHPELGQVKTRLAKKIGQEAALEVYQKLLAATRELCNTLDVPKAIYYAGEAGPAWMGASVYRQSEGDLGERMEHAFRNAFTSGFKKVVIIGSDCPELNSDGILKAFQALETQDLVIGPARDGGYYLLGMSHLIPELFQNKSWSTSLVLGETIEEARRLSQNVALLQLLSDLDTMEDLIRFRERGMF